MVDMIVVEGGGGGEEGRGSTRGRMYQELLGSG